METTGKTRQDKESHKGVPLDPSCPLSDEGVAPEPFAYPLFRVKQCLAPKTLNLGRVSPHVLKSRHEKLPPGIPVFGVW